MEEGIYIGKKTGYFPVFGVSESLKPLPIKI
jgi:hypothetical protein